MTITAKNIGRINVWPTYDAAREVDTEESEFVGRLTVYRTNAEARANLTSEGGGGGLDWVPENAVIHIDLVRAFNDEDAAWTAADGIVAVDTLLGSDPNTEGSVGASAYDPEKLTADGYVPEDGDIIALIGAAHTKVLAGATARAAYKGSGESTEFGLHLFSADGNYSLDFLVVPPDFLLSSSNGSGAFEVSDIVNVGAAVTNCLALTVTTTHADGAANGSDAETTVLDSNDYPTTGDSPLNTVFVSTNDGPTAWQSITLYDALPSTAGLSALSEVA